MKKCNRYLVIAPLLVIVSACGGGSGAGDTNLLKQIVEQNKFNITAITLNSKITQTYNPINTPGTTPTFYFSNTSDDEQLTVTGTNDSGEIIDLRNVNFEIIDAANTAGEVTIDSNNGNLYFGNLADMAANTTQALTVQVSFGGIIGLANIVISSHSLQANGLSLLILDKLANSTSVNATVCAETAIAARGIFSDGSTRSITGKIDWSKSIADSNAKFDVSDRNKPLFSAHTNAVYTLNVTYGLPEVTASVAMNVVQGNLDDGSMVISTTSKTITKSARFALTLSAKFNAFLKNKIETKAKWITADSTIVSVNTATGVVTGIRAGGPVLITASCGSQQQTSDITVN